jgi:hypothetical protein
MRMNPMSEQTFLFGPTWIPIKDGNPTGMSIFLRHYTARKNRKVFKFIGPGDKEALITPDAKALFVWRKFISDAGEEGVNCAVFRNEGTEYGKSSELILLAECEAVRRWGKTRLYTYVDPSKLGIRKRHSREYCPWPPGRCFIEAGWSPCGWTKQHKVILEKEMR